MEKNLSESCAYSLDRWNFRYAGPIFYPKSEDIGKQLCVVVDLGPKTIIRCVLSKDLIKDRPSEPLIFEERQAQHCAESASNGLVELIIFWNFFAAIANMSLGFLLKFHGEMFNMHSVISQTSKIYLSLLQMFACYVVQCFSRFIFRFKFATARSIFFLLSGAVPEFSLPLSSSFERITRWFHIYH